MRSARAPQETTTTTDTSTTEEESTDVSTKSQPEITKRSTRANPVQEDVLGTTKALAQLAKLTDMNPEAQSLADRIRESSMDKTPTPTPPTQVKGLTAR